MTIAEHRSFQRQNPDSPTPPTNNTRTERRLIGPPGCGKTTWLATQVKAAVQNQRRVLILSLTRAAAAEAAGRDVPVPPGAISTIHSLCYHLLNRPDIADSPANIKKWNERHPQFALSNQNAAASETPNLSSTGDHYMHVWQLHRARREAPPEQGPIRDFIDAWQAWNREHDMYDFTGLIETVLEKQLPPPHNPDLIFVDEAQDLSHLEMALVRQWGDQAGSLTLVGDPDQNLYQWRGTDWTALTSNPDDTVVQSETLSQSYRVSQRVHREAIRWLGRSPIRQAAQYRPTREAGDFRLSPGTFLQPKPVLDDLRDELRQKRSVMILASCSYMLDGIITGLRQAGIAFHNPFRTNNGRWNPLVSASRTIPAGQRLSAWLNYAQGNGWTANDLTLWSRNLYTKSTLSRGQAGLKELQDELDPDSDTPIPDQRLQEILTPEAFAAARAGNIDWYQQNLLAAARQGAEFACAIARAGGREALEQEPQVIVGTIHSVKGGEADTVYIFPDLSTDGMREWLSSPDRQAGVYRLFYVGMTRARHTLVLCRAATGLAVDF